MMGTIVKEELISFKELEKKIFAYVCELAREITVQMLESYGKEPAESRDKKQYCCKENARRCRWMPARQRGENGTGSVWGDGWCLA